MPILNRLIRFFDHHPCLRSGLYGALAALPFALIKHEISLAFLAALGCSLFLSHLFNASRSRDAFAWGWAFGFAYHTVALHWAVVPLSLDWAKFWPVAPLALFGIPAFLALYMGAVAALSCRLGDTRFQKYLLFCAGWTLMEYARSQYFLAFPWNLLGYVWVHSPLIQSTAYIGIYGLSSLSIAFFALPALMTRRARTGLIGSFCVFFLILDSLIPAYCPPPPVALTPHRVHLIQPSIPQSERWAPGNTWRHFEETLQMSQLPSAAQKELIIWSESGMDFCFENAPYAQKRIAQTLQANQVLLTGGIREEHNPFKVFNSLLAIDAQGCVLDHYDKSRLLPYGEYIPGRRYLPKWIVGIAAGDIDYTPGTGLRTIAIPGLPPFSPLICFEGAFCGEAVGRGGPRPDFLLSISNDAWFGETAGPYQHLQIVRVRAIEEGLPLVRVSNNGISALIAPDGQIIARLPLNTRGVLSAALPAPAAPTFFSQWSWQTFWRN